MRNHFKNHGFIYFLLFFPLIFFLILNVFVPLPISGTIYWGYAQNFHFANIDSPYFTPLFIKIYGHIAGNTPYAFALLKYIIFIACLALSYALSYLISQKRKIAILTVFMFISLSSIAKFLEHMDYHLVVILCALCGLYFLFKWHYSKKSHYIYLMNFAFACMLLAQFEAVALMAAIVLTSFCLGDFRKLWCNKHFYISWLIPVAMIIPFILWQIQHHWLTFAYLSASNATHRDIGGFLSAWNDYLGMLGLYSILFIMSLWSTRFFKTCSTGTLFLLLFFLFASILLNFIFMHSTIRHTSLITPIIAFLIYVAVTSGNKFFKTTWVFVILTLIFTLPFVAGDLIIKYNQNTIKPSTPLLKLMQQSSLIISNVPPFDNAPSYYSLLSNNSKIFAYQYGKPNYAIKGNPAVYYWQPKLSTLIANNDSKSFIYISDANNVPTPILSLSKCSLQKKVLIHYKTAASVAKLLKSGLTKQKNTLYTFVCINK